MSEQQIFDVWDVGLKEAKDLTIEGVHDDWEGFRILVSPYLGARLVRIAFDEPAAYLRRDESDLQGDRVRSTGLGRGNFYIVRNSEFLDRFLRDALRSRGSLNHYAIYSGVDCIDVLADEPPSIEEL
jgi:hypothetical protein